MKTLTEEVNEIVNKRGSKKSKEIELIKLGLTKSDISVILSSIKTIKAGKFDFSKLTFGVEIECYNCDRYTLISNARRHSLDVQSEGYNHTDGRPYYKIVSDASIFGNDGNEVVSPILKGDNGLNSLKTLCEALRETGARVNRSTGLHVHIGAANISDSHFVRVFRNYQKIEKVVDSFLPESRRENNNQYCMTMQRFDFSFCYTKRDVIETMQSRYYKVNAQSYLRHKTIEFRQHSGSVSYDKIANWVKFLAKLVAYSEKNEIVSCNSIEELPFLTESEKQYFIGRRNDLNTSES